MRLTKKASWPESGREDGRRCRGGWIRLYGLKWKMWVDGSYGRSLPMKEAAMWYENRGDVGNGVDVEYGRAIRGGSDFCWCIANARVGLV